VDGLAAGPRWSARAQHHR